MKRIGKILASGSQTIYPCGLLPLRHFDFEMKLSMRVAARFSSYTLIIVFFIDDLHAAIRN
jgi:hypothetical protein